MSLFLSDLLVPQPRARALLQNGKEKRVAGGARRC